LEAGEVSGSDPWCFEQAARPFDVLARPLTGGEYGFRLRYLNGPNWSIRRVHYASDARLVGLAPSAAFTFSVPLQLHDRSRYWGRYPDVPGLPAVLNDATDIQVAAGQEEFLILVDQAWLGENLCPELMNGLNSDIVHRFLPASPAGLSHLGGWLSRVIDGFWCDTETIRADRLAPAVVRAMEQDLLLGLTTAVRRSAPRTGKPPAWLRRQALQRSLDWLRAVEPGQFSIGRLCEVAGASQRTLEYTFRDAYQMSPAAFLRLWRLRAVRTALLAASPAVASVTEIAVEAGFYELGRFAGAYRRLFGERPSETLRRPCPPSPGSTHSRRAEAADPRTAGPASAPPQSLAASAGPTG
jgi:AraC-like DNA-binding protein